MGRGWQARLDRLATNDKTAAASRLLDSRVETWAVRSNLDPRQVRQWLREGHIVQFRKKDTGEEVYRIRPAEVA